ARDELVREASEGVEVPALERHAVEVRAGADMHGDERPGLGAPGAHLRLHRRALLVGDTQLGGRELRRDIERTRQAVEDVRHVLAVGVDDARREQPLPPLPVGGEADALGRPGEVSEDRRYLRELLEVDDDVVAAAAERGHHPQRRGDQRRVVADAERVDAADDRAAPEEGDVAALEREEVDLRVLVALLDRLDHREEHNDVAEPVELDGEETPWRSAGGRPERWWGRRPARCKVAAAERPRRPLEGAENGADAEPHPLVEVARDPQVHATARDYTS